MIKKPDNGPGNHPGNHPKNHPKNHHCSCVQIGSTGIMVEGPSGSGKSSLAMGLLELGARSGIAHGLICDDQALIDVSGGELWASAPAAIAGKIEVFGYGIAAMNFIQKARIDLVCRLVEQNEMPRMAKDDYCDRFGVSIACIKLPMRHEAQCIRILQLKTGIGLA